MEVGNRVKVNDVRTIWSTESDFSRWLASEEGLKLISQDLGFDIGAVRLEHRLGSYPCDVSGHAIGDEEHRFVIENQFGNTDHDHLGKLITHAITHRASTAIWIAERSSHNHRKAIDWLNGNTPRRVRFYLCELQAFSIDGGRPAPQLNLVCRPDAADQAPENLGDVSSNSLEKWRNDFWEEILDHLATGRPSFNLPLPNGSNKASIATGKSRFYVNMLLSSKRDSVGVELCITVTDERNSAFYQLFKCRDNIEALIGSRLRWDSLPGRKVSKILWEKKIDARDPANRERVKDWFGEAVPRFFFVFQPLILALDSGCDSVAEDDPFAD